MIASGEGIYGASQRASLIHIPGDMKRWPAMRNLLRYYLPPWRERPKDDGFEDSSLIRIPKHRQLYEKSPKQIDNFMKHSSN